MLLKSNFIAFKNKVPVIKHPYNIYRKQFFIRVIYIYNKKIVSEIQCK